MHAAHELGLVLGEEVVDGDDVHALAGEGVEVGREGRDERLALTGLHLGDVALVQRGAAHDLHVEVPLAEGALARLTHGREGLGQEHVEGLAVVESLAETLGLVAQLLVGELLEVGLEGIDLLGDALELLQGPALAGAKQLLDDGHLVISLPTRTCGPARWAGSIARDGSRDPPRLAAS